jgi:hypothetical protein
MKLDAGDAAELAEMLQFLSQWLARDPARLGPSLEEFVGHPAPASPSCAKTWSGSSSCSAAATANRFSVHDGLRLAEPSPCRCEDGGHARGSHS